MQPATLKLIATRKAAKGDVLAVAQLAGIMAAKKTPDLIPLCHPLALSSVDVELTLDEPSATPSTSRRPASSRAAPASRWRR